jgi:flagellar basal-body rod modification protein FlgD
MAIDTDWAAQNRPGITSSTAIMGKGVESMGMEDFFNLLMAQMTNQDIMNPTDNTQMIAQMAQFSSLQAMNGVLESTTALSEYQQLAYATNYVGKTVTIAEVGEDDKIKELSGVVEKVTFYDGKPMVFVDGKGYELHKVMQVTSSEQMSSSQAASSLQQATSSYLGKYVILTHVDADGEPHNVEGYVESVTLKAGQANVVIGEESYPASAITDVFTTKEAAHPEDDETNGTDAVRGSRSFADLDPNKSYVFDEDDLEALHNGTY